MIGLPYKTRLKKVGDFKINNFILKTFSDTKFIYAKFNNFQKI